MTYQRSRFSCYVMRRRSMTPVAKIPDYSHLALVVMDEQGPVALRSRATNRAWTPCTCSRVGSLAFTVALRYRATSHLVHELLLRTRQSLSSVGR